MSEFPKQLTIGGFPVEQVAADTYQAENPAQEFDFVFLERPRGRFETLIFDSRIKTATKRNDPFVADFMAASLPDAVADAFNWKRRNGEIS